ncbi:MAG TPA: hypothetical protein VK699_06695 [Terriglobales bacterium]|nr:hypothetical protein [Terriglobales bacterium]
MPEAEAGAATDAVARAATCGRRRGRLTVSVSFARKTTPISWMGDG